jgi:hypothetical protein
MPRDGAIIVGDWSVSPGSAASVVGYPKLLRFCHTPGLSLADVGSFVAAASLKCDFSTQSL